MYIFYSLIIAVPLSSVKHMETCLRFMSLLDNMMKLSDYLSWYKFNRSGVVIIQSTKSRKKKKLEDHMTCLVHVVMHSWLFCVFFLMSFRKSHVTGDFGRWHQLFSPSSLTIKCNVIHGLTCQFNYNFSLPFSVCVISECERSLRYVT